jgi:hypothetical protein
MRRHRRVNSVAAKEFWKLAKKGDMHETYIQFLERQQQRIDQAGGSIKQPFPAEKKPIVTTTLSIVNPQFQLHTAAEELRGFLEK